MHNRKLKGSIAVLALSAVLVGGTFAWLGSTDSLVNKFTSKPSSIPNENNNKGVDIYEVFDTTKANQSVAGTAVNKDVQVKNTADFNSLIRVNFEKIFIDDKDNEILDSVLVDEKNIELNFDEKDVITLEKLNDFGEFLYK